MYLSDSNQEIYLVITNEVDKKNAPKVADLLLKEKIIACVSFKNIESFFWWEGSINQLKEVQLMIKCKKENVNNVCNKIAEWHSYEIPEIIYFRGSANKKYHHWVNSI